MTYSEIKKHLQNNKHQLRMLAYSIGRPGLKAEMAYHHNLINLYQNKLNRLFSK